MQLLSSKKLAYSDTITYRDAKNLAIRAGIPVVPGYNGSDQSVSKLIEEIHKIDYPVLLKATMGGGGRVWCCIDDSFLGNACFIQ